MAADHTGVLTKQMATATKRARFAFMGISDWFAGILNDASSAPFPKNHSEVVKKQGFGPNANRVDCDLLQCCVAPCKVLRQACVLLWPLDGRANQVDDGQ